MYIWGGREDGLGGTCHNDKPGLREWKGAKSGMGPVDIAGPYPCGSKGWRQREGVWEERQGCDGEGGGHTGEVSGHFNSEAGRAQSEGSTTPGRDGCRCPRL